jgi:hypothetical protein
MFVGISVTFALDTFFVLPRIAALMWKRKALPEVGNTT